MRAESRLWRTEDGDLVEDGHPEASVLAYGEDDELTEDDAKKIRKPAPAKKAAPEPANKKAPKAADKQAAPPKNK
ncbi:hypothetical protein L2K70_04745 [Nocardioides KLBMP 9356]|uniref:Uncharacterized protein n=1 Tax=Nocardioides potassii TaxID=2911371 RepID=A0ABS9H9B6_9ACTN|nr:hypothetical protein [Nocardioides potassii]MCF6376903.1 hypothetical protein [Nocardioides potassii]